MTTPRDMKLSADAPFIQQTEFAWPGGDRPGNLDFRYEPSTPIIAVLQEALAPFFAPIMAEGASIRALFPSNGPVGRYRLSTQEGSWFVRVSTRPGNPELERAITDYLVSKGLSICPLLIAGQTLRWNGQTFRIDVRPMIEGRHFDGSSDDLRRLASTLAACHRALKDFPRAHEVRAAAVVRNQRLAKTRERIVESLRHGRFDLFAEHASWAASHRSWLDEMAEQFDPRLYEHPDAQCVHGEVHPGNILFRSSDGTAVLVDFEESIHLFMPPTWDLAFLVQRFCLRDHPSPSVARQRLAVVTDGYGGSLSSLTQMMRQAAWFTMATIVDLRVSQSVVTPVAELEKFVELERQALAYEGIV